MGDSVARYEGDQLVIETTNFTSKTRFRGASENLKVTERFWRADDNTIMYRFTVEDPDDLGAAVDRRISVGEGGGRRSAVRVRLPRGQPRDDGHHEGRAAPRSRGRGDPEATAAGRGEDTT